jgi:hypothetical protein
MYERLASLAPGFVATFERFGVEGFLAKWPGGDLSRSDTPRLWVGRHMGSAIRLHQAMNGAGQRERAADRTQTPRPCARR